MTRLNELALTFLLNATWQIIAVVLVTSLCARLLRRAPARLRHALWLAALVFSVALPAWTLGDLTKTAQQTVAQKPALAPPTNDGLAAPTSVAPAPAGAAVAVTDEPAAPLPRPSRRKPVSLNFTPALMALALSYALFLFMRLYLLLRAWRWARRVRRTARPLALSPAALAVAARCRAAFGLRDVPILCAREVRAPITVGAFAPVIILPEGFAAGSQTEMLASVLGHEMAHVARRDYALNLACELLVLPVSFHPLALWTMRQIRRTRELACDELVAARVLAPAVYARSLVRVAQTLVAPRGRACAPGIFDADILEERVKRLLTRERRMSARLGVLSLTGIFVLLAALGLNVPAFSFHLQATGEAAPYNQPTAARATAPVRGETAQTKTQGAISATQDGAVKTGAAQELTPDQSRAALAEAQTQTQTGAPSDDTVALRTLTMGNADERAAAACALGRAHAVAAIPALVQMLGDDSPVEPVRCWEQGTWSPALSSFKQPAPGEQAAIALAALGQPAVAPLVAALSDANPNVRRNAAWAIGEVTGGLAIDRSDAVAPLLAALRDADDWVRAAAARSLSELRPARAGGALLAALSDSSPRVREYAAWALGEMKDRRAVQDLSATLLNDDSARVRAEAAKALGEIADPQAQTALHAALNDSDPRVRAEARSALAELEG